MLKSFIAVGVTLVIIGAVVLVGVVIPAMSVDLPLEATRIQSGWSSPASVLGAFASGVLLAAGLFLIGIGVGHWKRPQPSSEGGPEV